jgi:hypothetical protein
MGQDQEGTAQVTALADVEAFTNACLLPGDSIFQAVRLVKQYISEHAVQQPFVMRYSYASEMPSCIRIEQIGESK